MHALACIHNGSIKKEKKMINVRAAALEVRLNELSRITGRSKSYFVRVALQTYLDRQSVTSAHYFPVEEELVALGSDHGIS